MKTLKSACGMGSLDAALAVVNNTTEGNEQ